MACILAENYILVLVQQLTSIVEHVASELRKKLTREIVTRCRKIAVLVDESTTLGKESALIIYI